MFKTAMKYLLALAAVAVAAFGVAACGGDEEGSATAAVQEASADKAQAAAEEAQAQVAELAKQLEEQEEQANSEPPPPAPETASEPEPAEAPDVVGLTLPAAESALKDAGFKADVSNTDTMFGIVVPQNYTVCKQQEPRGNLVPVLAQKYGC
jgi:HK97 family phage major capsid protein